MDAKLKGERQLSLEADAFRRQRSAVMKGKVAEVDQEVDDSVQTLCDPCVKTKLKQVCFRLSPRRPAMRPLERVHFDISPKNPVPGANGEVGFLVAKVDDAGSMVVLSFPVPTTDLASMVWGDGF